MAGSGRDIVKDFSLKDGDMLSFKGFKADSIDDFKMADGKTGVTVTLTDGSTILFEGVTSKMLLETKALFE